jgi:D-tyrosyl-tRNA(Tyr) deacylase
MLLQRVSAGAVTVEEMETRSIGRGLVAFLGIAPGDTEKESRWLVEKILNLRLFPNDNGQSEFDRSVRDIEGEILLVSQFTLYADMKKGRRPDFTRAAPPDRARGIYQRFVAILKELHPRTVTGEFGASMRVEIRNQGPVTLFLDTAS